MTVREASLANFVAEPARPALKPYSVLGFAARLALIVILFSVVGLTIGLVVPRSSLMDPQGDSLPTLSGP